MSDIENRSLAQKIIGKIQFQFGFTVRYIYKQLFSLPIVVRAKNKQSKITYERGSHALNDLQEKILLDLKENGLAITHIRQLMPETNILSDLTKVALKELEEANIGRKKKFLIYAWDNKPTLELSNPLLKIALEEKILTTVNAYLGLFSRLAFCSINKTLVVGKDAVASGSQRWHRDPSGGDEKICKIFIYLSDVEENSGPFMYIKGSHRSGKFGNIFPSKQPDGIYPPNESIEKSELKKHTISLVGTAGTIVFCDTTGMHKGGFSINQDRIMATLLYTSPGSIFKANWKTKEHLSNSVKVLPKQSQYALLPNFNRTSKTLMSNYTTK